MKEEGTKGHQPKDCWTGGTRSECRTCGGRGTTCRQGKEGRQQR